MADRRHDTPLATLVGVEPGAPRPPVESCLVAIYGPNLGRRFALSRRELVIGRDPSCDVVVPLETVSRRHCRIALRGERASATDLGSTNGTFVNEAPVRPHEEVVLASGDLLRVGSAILKYLEGGDVEALYHEEIYRSRIADGLTGAHNRRYLDETLEREMVRATRHGRPLALVLFDLDHFKRVNDEFGHLTGDALLREVAALAAGHVRREDCFARYGGEEFAIVLTETDLDGARGFAERLCEAVAAHPFVAGAEPLRITASFGVAALEPGMQGPAVFLESADRRLYEAKRAGRGCVR